MRQTKQRRAVRRHANRPADGDAFRMRVKIGERAFETIGIGDIVAVEAGDDIGLGMPQRIVAGFHNAGIGFRHHHHARILRGEIGEDFRRIVGGAVIDDDDADVLQRLRAQTSIDSRTVAAALYAGIRTSTAAMI